MKIELSVKRKYLSYAVFAAIIVASMSLAVAQYNDPSLFGHTWDQVECNGCIVSSSIEDNTVTNADINSVAWSRVTGIPTEWNDGDDNTAVTCSWTGGSVRGGSTITCTEGVVTGIL